MSEFILLFRRDYQTEELQPSSEQIEKYLKPWQDWVTELASGNKLARPLKRLDAKGRIIVKNKIVTQGPYIELTESIGGMIILKAENYGEAVETVKSCPILQLGVNVEIRMSI